MKREALLKLLIQRPEDAHDGESESWYLLNPDIMIMVPETLYDGTTTDSQDGFSLNDVYYCHGNDVRTCWVIYGGPDGSIEFDITDMDDIPVTIWDRRKDDGTSENTQGT